MAVVFANSGRAIITGRLKGLGTEPLWVGWGTGAGTAAATDTTLFTETGTRVAGSSSSDSGVYRVTGTLTATGATTVTNAGLFDAITSGNLFTKVNFSSIALIANETISFLFAISDSTISAIIRVTGASSPIVVSSLLNGLTYSGARVRANYGTSGSPDWGPWSAYSSSFTPA